MKRWALAVGGSLAGQSFEVDDGDTAPKVGEAKEPRVVNSHHIIGDDDYVLELVLLDGSRYWFLRHPYVENMTQLINHLIAGYIRFRELQPPPQKQN